MNLNEIIEIYSLSTEQDEYGTISGERTLISTVYARVSPISGREIGAGDQVEGAANYRFTVHQSNEFDHADVIVWRGTDYNIRFVANNGEFERYMRIDAERGVAI